ncbi:MAG TPA: IPTL-CTERM sorting domain-containing protein, partial [Burkholderiaceae bacterium]
GPDAVNDSASTLRNTAVTGVSVATNDTYPSGATFMATTPPPSHGTLTSLDATTGTYVYTPANNFTGTDTFSYKLCLPEPNETLCDTAAVDITVKSPTAVPTLAAWGLVFMSSLVGLFGLVCIRRRS